MAICSLSGIADDDDDDDNDDADARGNGDDGEGDGGNENDPDDALFDADGDCNAAADRAASTDDGLPALHSPMSALAVAAAALPLLAICASHAPCHTTRPSIAWSKTLEKIGCKARLRAWCGDSSDMGVLRVVKYASSSSHMSLRGSTSHGDAVGVITALRCCC